MDVSSDTRRLIAEIDFGGSPAGVLVVRESRLQRVIGVVAGLVIGVPASWAATMLALYFDAFETALIFALVALVGLGGSVWLLHEILNATCYYLALDNEYLYRRRGPRKLSMYSLAELGEFGVHRGVLRVSHRTTKKNITIIKSVYAPENISALARRMNLWRLVPPSEREVSVTQLNILEAEAARCDASRRVARGFGLLCLYPILLVLTVHLRLFQVHGLSVALWCIYTYAGALMLVGGLVRLIKARSKQRQLLVSPTQPSAELRA